MTFSQFVIFKVSFLFLLTFVKTNQKREIFIEIFLHGAQLVEHATGLRQVTPTVSNLNTFNK